MSNELKFSGVGAVSGDKKQSTVSDEDMDYRDPFPPQLSIRPTVFNRQEAFQRWPGLEKTLDNLKAECEKISYPFEMSGVVECRRKLAGIESDDMSYGQALVLNLPPEFELYISGLAVQKPSLMTCHSLDKNRLMVNYEWTCNLSSGKQSLMIQPYPLYESGLIDCFTWYEGERRIDSLLFVPVVFVSGNWVACGGFYYDAYDFWMMQSADILCEGYRAFLHWSSDEIKHAKELADYVGTAYPWVGKNWLDPESNTYLRQIFIKINKGNDAKC